MKLERLIKKDQKNKEENNKDLFLEEIKVLTKFDTEGYDEYDTLSFKKEIKEKNIDPKKTLESYLEYLVKNDKHGDFSVAEMNFHSGMRAWLHCDYKEAISFIEEKFNFFIKNGDNLDFAKKYKFLNLVSVFIFENMNVDEDAAAQSNIVSNERSVFSKLKNAKNKENNSFLLNYFASDFCSVIDKERQYVKGEKLEYIPFEIAPKTFALDKKSDFIMISKNNFKEDSLYVSDPKDFEKIQEILKKVKENTFPEQEVVDELTSYFNPIYVLNKGSKDLDMQIFRKLNEPYHRDKLKEITGIDFNQISIDEQFYFLNYLKFSNQDDLAQIKEFSEKYKENGFKTFLSIAHGGQEMGDKILTLGEKLPKESADILFQTYSDMVDATDEIKILIKENLGEKANPLLINQARESLLIGGKDLLLKYAKKVSTCEGEDCINTGEELKDKLSLAQKSVFAFSYACKTLVERGEFNFEDFQKAQLVYEKSPLAEDIKNQIIDMHKINTKQYPLKLRELWRGTLKEGLEKANPNQLVVSVSFKEHIVSAMRVIEQEDGSWYGASFNINPTVQGSRVGSELLKRVLQDLAKEKPFVADCYSKNPMLDTYLKKFGFKITKEIENYENTGELVYQITLYPEN